MGVMLDCPDAKELSAFYAELLGKPVTYEADGMAMIGNDGAQPVMFQQVDGYTRAAVAGPGPPAAVPPRRRWSTTSTRARRPCSRWAPPAATAHGENWRVFADPAGKPFCLGRWRTEHQHNHGVGDDRWRERTPEDLGG